MAEPFIGQISLYGFSFTPEKWAKCDGALMSIADNQALFALIGTYYGGNGQTSFALPDFRGRLPVSQGTHPGSSYDWQMGETKGLETHTMSTSEMPTHSHLVVSPTTAATVASTATATARLYAEKGSADTGSAADNLLGAITASNTFKTPAAVKDNQALSLEAIEIDPITIASRGAQLSASIDNSGSSAAFNLIQSSLVINFCIALQGLFPSRG